MTIDFDKLDIFDSGSVDALEGLVEQSPEDEELDNEVSEALPEASTEENDEEDYLFPEEREDNTELPEKFRGKELSDVVQMYQELEKVHGKLSSKAGDLQILEQIERSAGNNALFQKALLAIVEGSEDKLKELFHSDTDYDDDYSLDDGNKAYSKEIDTLKAEIAELKRVHIDAKTQATATEQVRVDIGSSIAYVKDAFKLDIDQNELVEFAQKHKDKLGLTSFRHAATELAARKIARAKSAARERQGGTRGPKMPESSGSHGGAEPIASSWDDFRSMIKQTINKE